MHEVVAGIEDEVGARQHLPRLAQRRHHERIVGVAAVLRERLLPALQDRGPGSGIGLDQLVDDGRIGERVEMDVGEDQEHALVGARRERQVGLLAGRTGTEQEADGDHKCSYGADPQSAALPCTNGLAARPAVL